MKLTVQTFLTLDGVMRAPGGPEEDPSGTFTDGGWQAPFPDPLMEPYATDGLRVRPRDVADIRQLGYRYGPRGLAAAGPRQSTTRGQSLAAAVGFFCSLPGHQPSESLEPLAV
jgi:hypothetical protein